MHNGSVRYRVYAGASGGYLNSVHPDKGASFNQSPQQALSYGRHYALVALRYARACGWPCWLVQA